MPGALLEGVTRRRFEAACVAGHAVTMQLAAMLAFDEELVIVAPRVHPAMVRAQEVCTDTIICFPVGCAYRRLLHAWLVTGNIVSEKVLELGSYHTLAWISTAQNYPNLG